MNPEQTYIIAEAGVNHNGSLDMAIELIDIAVNAQANAVKFQTFRAEALVSRAAPRADYQNKNTGDDESQYEMLKKLELDENQHRTLIDYAKSKTIEFLSTPFDLESLYLLSKTFNIRKIKVPSGEITNAPFLLEIAKNADQIILSTGMSTLSDIEAALGVIAFGFTEAGDEFPNLVKFSKAFASERGKRELRKRVTLLHATTEYPAPLQDINLNAMHTMASAFGLPVGYSDHSEGVHIPVAAVAKGACLIEKHFTLDKNLPGPDHKASLEPQELKQMIKLIREIEVAMGDGLKVPASSEWKNQKIARKSLHANRSIEADEVFSMENLTVKRPGDGIPPIQYWEYLGKKSNRSYSTDEMIRN
ncbi:N-acetylneuraminate synthase [Leptospira kmetyi]|uniref:N-acetylneuraminate synthase n=1 Tax=Leptospira kmetyi TaxID=408139 RepID=UPI0010841C30|nr:N-acetylneuraminate synthase [Leptospira kmetyi]TGL68272.1 N-acetylneuraminate synthase [Leptospira kmetyi]